VGAIEKKFHDTLFRLLDMNPADYPPQSDQSSWKMMKGVMVQKFRQKTRDEWVAHFGDAEVCVAPVLSASEAAAHPHNRARGTFVEIDGVMQPAPAPRFSRTQTDLPDPPQPMTEENSLAALKQWLDPVKAEAWLAASKG
jgi:crotonobetainyl-CoA:carnitine CoA-transferase CaiB-like acyl-CoA transferase